jgi:hypothetical protein
MATWGGFDYANVIANRQKGTYVHGFLDVSGPIRSQTLVTLMDSAQVNGLEQNTIVKSYTKDNPVTTGTYYIDGLAGSGNAIIVNSNIKNGQTYDGNAFILTNANIPLGCNVFVPRFSNVSYRATVPLGYNLSFNSNIANVFYTGVTSSNIVLTKSNGPFDIAENITLLETHDYLKANNDYKIIPEKVIF